MPTSLEKKRLLDNRFSGQIMRVALIADNPTVGTVTFTAATDTVNHSGHDFVAGCRVRFSTTGTLDGLSAATTYRVVNPATGTYQLALEADFDPTTGGLKAGSSLVNITGAGTGTHTATEQPFSDTLDSSVNQLVRKEVAYQGSGRQSITLPAATISGNNASIPAQTFPNIQPTSGPITFRYAAFIRGGSATAGNVTGELVTILDNVTTQTIAQNGTYAATWQGAAA